MWYQSRVLSPGGLLCTQRQCDFPVVHANRLSLGYGYDYFQYRLQVHGGSKYGTGPGRGEERELWPIATHPCPTCGASFPAGLHLCHTCAKPIHYPDGMFYADQKDKFGVEYYGIHAQWLYDVIVSGRTDDYRLHTYAGINTCGTTRCRDL